MPTIEFEGNFFGDDQTVDAPDGGAIVDICDESTAPVPFSCRSATCGTCRIEILEGSDLLEPREEAEADLHDILGDPENVRLACQAKLKKGPGVVRIRIADEEI